MNLSYNKQKEIQSYFYLDEINNNLKEKVNNLRSQFYNQTFSTRTMTNERDIITVGFSCDRDMMYYLDSVSSIEDEMEINCKKIKYFNQYMNALPIGEYQYLINRYKKGHLGNEKVTQKDIDLYAEIQEIEIAINYIYGFPQELTNDVISKDSPLITNVNNIAVALGV